MRFQKGEFCKNWDSQHVNFRIKCGFLPRFAHKNEILINFFKHCAEGYSICHGSTGTELNWQVPRSVPLCVGLSTGPYLLFAHSPLSKWLAGLPCFSSHVLTEPRRNRHAAINWFFLPLICDIRQCHHWHISKFPRLYDVSRLWNFFVVFLYVSEKNLSWHQ